MPDRTAVHRGQCIVAGLLLGILATSGRADDENGASWYSRAFEREAVLTDADWAALDAYWENRGGPLPPQYRSIMSRARPALELARRGAKQGHSDFGLDRSQGFELMLPHLAAMRSMGKLLRHDVILHMHDGDHAGAAERVGAIYEMAGHVQSDGILISSLVGVSIFGLGEETADLIGEHGGLGPQEAARLLNGLERFAGPDPFGMGAAVQGEREMITGWLGGLPADERADTLVNSLGWMDDAEAGNALGDLSEEAFSREMTAYDDLMVGVVEAFSNEDREAGRAELAALTTGIESGDHGILAQVLAPSLGRVFEKMVVMEAKLAARRADLQAIVDGDVDPRRRANAAYLYAEAIRTWREIPAGMRRSVTAWRTASEGAPPEDVAETLLAAAPVVALVTEAAQLERCDFSVIRHPWRWQWCPDYIGGVHELLDLLHATALASSRRGDSATAMDPLAAALGMTAHLAGDERLMSSVVSHAGFRRTRDLLTEFDIASSPVDVRTSMGVTLDRFARGDPFGYASSLAASRREARNRLLSRLRDEPDVADRVRASTAAWDGDELLHVLMTEEAMATRAEPFAAPSNPTPLIGTVLDAAELEAVMADVDRIVEWLDVGLVELFADMPASRPAQIAKQRPQARGDYRRAAALLDVVPP